VSWAINEKSFSQARDCGLVGLRARTFRRKPRRSTDGVLGACLKALAAERRRFSYRRRHVLLQPEGFAVNHKKLFRIYREERLTVRTLGGRTRTRTVDPLIKSPETS
jgi:putative transposase